ncbi:MAG: zf-HC2 domain-containing protein [Myxococcota bacterium]
MMTCKDVERFLDDYLEGSLPLMTRIRFELHVRMCAECGPYIARYRRAIELGQQLLAEKGDADAAEAVPEELIDVILKSIDEG